MKYDIECCFKGQSHTLTLRYQDRKNRDEIFSDISNAIKKRDRLLHFSSAIIDIDEIAYIIKQELK